MIENKIDEIPEPSEELIDDDIDGFTSSVNCDDSNPEANSLTNDAVGI